MNHEVKIVRKYARSFEPDDVSKVYQLQNRMEITTHPRKKRLSGGATDYRRCGGNECINIVTGEIKQFKRNASGEKSLQSMRKAFAQLGRIINANFSTDDSEVHITLSYEKAVDDHREMAGDLKRFKQRLLYYRADIEYISVLEPHASGRWHCHLLVKQIDGELLSIPIEVLRKMWSHGRIYIGRLRFSSNPGGYFASKPYKYPERMPYYRSGMRFYQCSSGIVRPKPVEMMRKDIDQHIAENDFRYKKSWTYDAILTHPEGFEYIINSVTHEIYERPPTSRQQKQKK